MDQSHQNEAQDLLPSQNSNVDKEVATTSDVAASQQPRKRTASAANIDKNQENVQTDVNTNAANGDDVPVQKKRKVEAKPRAQPRPKKRSSTSGKMDMAVFCQHAIVTSTPKPNPYVQPIYSVTHTNTIQLSPIQKHSLPLLGVASNPFTNFVKVPEDVQKVVLFSSDDENVPNILSEIVEDPSVQIIEQSFYDAVAGCSGMNQVAEDIIVINDSNPSDIIAVPAMPTITKRKATKSNNKPKRRQQKKTKDPEEVIPNAVCNEKPISPSTIHLRNCPVCLDTLDDKSISCTICGHIFCTRCITKIVKSQKECPTCRTRLTKTKIHPLFI